MELLRKINLVIGYLLLTPGILSVFYFLIAWYSLGFSLRCFYLPFIPQGTTEYGMNIVANNNSPMYLTLMAIAGAYLITANLKPKENEK
jgi:hypothetical protein